MYVVRKRGLGDVLWIEPVVRELAGRHRKVIVYTKYPELFDHYPLPNVVFKKDLSVIEKIGWRLERFLHTSFLFIDLDGAYERTPKMHFLSAYQRKAGLTIKNEYPRLYLTEAEKASRPAGGPYVILHLETEGDKNYRRVYGVDWNLVVRHLHEKGFAVWQLGKKPPEISGAPLLKTSLREMIPVIGNAAFFIGLDSGPSHIAASLGIPSLIFFGAVDPAYRHFSDLFKGRILQQPCEYAGCYHEGPPGIEPVCRLVGAHGIPKCSVHTTEFVLKNIDLLIKAYNE